MKLINKFRYCPVCGSSHFEQNDFKSLRCSDCGFVFYNNASAAAVGVVINDKKELLVSVRANDPVVGTYDLPGGFVDPGENLEDAVIRELAEETGGKLIVDRYLFSLPNSYLFSDLTVETTDCFFLSHFADEKHLVAADDVHALLWLSVDNLDVNRFGLISIRKSIPLIKNIIRNM